MKNEIRNEKLEMRDGKQIKLERQENVNLKKAKIISFFLLVLLLSFFSCGDPFLQNDSVNASGEGVFILNISGKGAPRTIMPELAVNDFVAYDLEFTSGSDTKTFSRLKTDIGDPISLLSKTWNLNVTAYFDSGKTQPAAVGTLTGIVITANGTTSKSIVLSGITESGEGTFKWSIEYPVEVVNAGITIIPVNETTGTAKQTYYIEGGGTPSKTKDDFVTLNSGFYKAIFFMDNGSKAASREEYLHIYKDMESLFEYTFTSGFFITVIVSAGDDDGNDVTPAPGSFRHAIKYAEDNTTINITVDKIELVKRIIVDKSLTIEGNGVIITKKDTWLDNDGESQLLYVDCGVDQSVAPPELLPPPEVNINRVHFTGGRSQLGGAICNYRGYLLLESCIFSDNRSVIGSGGAIYNSQFANGLEINGCTFYGNTSTMGNAITNVSDADEGYAVLTGNVFYGNTPETAVSPEVVFSSGSVKVVSGGYNVVDGEYGDLSKVFDVETTATDKSVETPVVAPVSFKVLTGSEAAGIIVVLPANYPTKDFFGSAITNGASAGAIQAFGVGFALKATPGNEERGYVFLSGDENEDGLYDSSVTLTAMPKSGSIFAHWIVNSVVTAGSDSWTFVPSSHVNIQAVFGLLVDSADDTLTEGTLRFAISNAESEDIIWIDADSLDGEITLTTPLPSITSDKITIEGNGAVLTRSTTWSTNAASQMLINDGSGTVIRRLHFKGGSAALGGAIRNNDELLLESCIFNENESTGTASTDGGGAVYNNGTLSVKACTFYGNKTASQGAAIFNQGGALDLTGNLFYENTGTTLVHRVAGTVTSFGFNVFDGYDSGFTVIASDKNSVFPLILAEHDFMLIPASEAANIINVLPAEYPNKDFYGDSISNNAAAGAVQSAVSSTGRVLVYSVNNETRGEISQSGASADSFGLYSGTVTLTAAKIGDGNHEFVHWKVNGEVDDSGLTLNLDMNQHCIVQAIFGTIVNKYDVDDTSEGTLRAALTGTTGDDYIWFQGVTPGVTAIVLDSGLPMISNRSVTMEGNGITITKGPGYTTSTGSRLLTITGSAAYTIHINRVHFKDGLINPSSSSTSQGAAIYCTSNLILESCILSNNRINTSGGYTGLGAAISLVNANVNLELYGCTFYGNIAIGANGGGVLYSTSTSTTRRWVSSGNIFYGNDNYSFHISAYPTWTGNYNIFEDTTSSVPPGAKKVTASVVSPVSFKPIAGSDATNFIPSKPAYYPTFDFFGTAITYPASAGAIQSTVSGGYAFDLLQGSGGTAEITSGTPDGDGLYNGTVIVEAVPNSSVTEVVWWLVNGVKVDSGTTLEVTMDASKAVKPVYGISVTSGADSGPGTLRQAFIDIPSSYEQQLTVAVKVPLIELDSLVSVAKDYVTIEGNSVVITPSASWDGETTLLSAGYAYMKIRDVHFKNAPYGSIIVNGSSSSCGFVYFYSCIFSGNQGRPVVSSGRGNVLLYGCTFYNNNIGSLTELLYQGRSSSSGIYYYSGYFVYGCLFYDNYGDGPIRLLGYYSTTDSTISAYYNVSDLPLGTSSGEAGWTASYTNGYVNFTGNKSLDDLGVTGVPFDTTTFRPNTTALQLNYNAAPTDFYGNVRTGYIGAVNY